MTKLRNTLLLLALLPCAADAQWRPQDQQVFVESCAQACRPNLAPESRDQCTAFCRCVMEGAQKEYPDVERFERLLAERDPAFLRAYNAIINACNMRLFGVPSKPLE
jgi:hypothetical protein